MMKKEVVILIAEDDLGHFTLIEKNLKRAGIINQIIHFKDGQEILDYLFVNGKTQLTNGGSYLLLLDIRMPKIDGIEVLQKIKEHQEFKLMPVIMLTTTDDPKAIEKCYELGCSTYIVKPLDYKSFMESIRNLGLFLTIVEVPSITMEQ